MEWVTTAERAVAVENLTVPSEAAPDVAVRRYGPPIGDGGPAPVLWVHGGAFVGGDLDQHESHAVALALAGRGRPVVTVHYRLAPLVNWVKPLREEDLKPGTRYPAALNDVTTVLNWVTSQAPQVILGGASAGAALAAATTLRNRDRGQALPTALILAYGTFHAALPPISPELRKRIRGIHGITQFRPGTVDTMNLNYAGSRTALSNPHAFPGGGDLTGFPRTLLLDADRDSLRSSGTAFRDELTRSGVDTTYRVVHGSRHGLLNRPGTAHFDTGIEAILQWLAH